MNKATNRIELPVQTRASGKHHSRQSRLNKLIPAVVYGPKTGNKNLLLDEVLIQKYVGRRYESTIFLLKSDDPSLDKAHVLVKSVQTHPVSRRPVHIDFYALDMSQNIRVRIAIRLDGKAVGLTEGGLLQAITREVEIECKPDSIPELITADVSNLHVGDSLHVSDLQVPDGVKIISNAGLTIATVSVMAEEVVAPVAAAAPAEGAAPAAGATPAAAAAAPAADKKK